MRTISEWNKYLEDLKRFRDMIYEGTKTTDGLYVKLEMEDCNIIWELLNSEANIVFNTPLGFNHRKLRIVILSMMENIQDMSGMLNVYVHDARKDFGLVILMCRK